MRSATAGTAGRSTSFRRPLMPARPSTTASSGFWDGGAIRTTAISRSSVPFGPWPMVMPRRRSWCLRSTPRASASSRPHWPGRHPRRPKPRHARASSTRPSPEQPQRSHRKRPATTPRISRSGFTASSAVRWIVPPHPASCARSSAVRETPSPQGTREPRTRQPPAFPAGPSARRRRRTACPGNPSSPCAPAPRERPEIAPNPSRTDRR